MIDAPYRMKYCCVFLCILISFATAFSQEEEKQSLDALIKQVQDHADQEAYFSQAFEALEQIITYSLPLSDSLIQQHIISSKLFGTKDFQISYHIARSQQAAVLFQSEKGQAHLDSARLLASNSQVDLSLNKVLFAQASFDLNIGNYRKSQSAYRELFHRAVAQQLDTLQVLCLLQIADINITLWQVPKAFQEIDSAQILATGVHQLEVQKEKCWAIYQSGNLQGALDSIQILQKECVRKGNQQLDIACEKLIAQIHYHRGIYLPAIAGYTRILEYARSNHDRVEMISQLSNIAYAHRMLGNFSEAISYAERRINYCDSLGYELGKAVAYLSMYQVYLDNKDATLQLESIRKAEIIYEKYGDRGGLANVYNSYGNAYESIRDYEKSLSYYQKCFEIRKNHAQSFWVVPLYNIGNILVKLGRDQESMAYFQESLRVCEEQHIIGMKIRNLSGLAEANLHLGIMMDSQSQIEQAVTMVKSTRYQRMKRDVYEIASMIFEKQGDYKNALTYFQLFKIQNDSLFNEESDERFALMQTQFETKEKEQENELLKKDVALKAADIKSQRQWTVIAVVVLFFSLIGGAIFYRNNQTLKEKNTEIEYQRESIEKRNKQIETLLKEVHHRVKNNLQLITSLLDSEDAQNDPHRAISILEDSKSRVATMSLIHQRLYMKDETGQIRLEDYLHDLVSSLIGLYEDRIEVNVHIKSEPIQLDIDTMIPLGLAMNELITNALKYASKGENPEIMIQCYSEADSAYVVKIKDQGAALPKALSELVKTGYGLRLAYRLSHQLMGSLSHEYDAGNIFTLKFYDTKFRKSVD